MLDSFSDDKDGRILVVNIQLFDVILHIVSVYAPNIEIERMTFHETKHKTILKHCNNLNNVILGGDFSTCLRPEDRYPRLVNKANNTSALKNLIAKCNHVDRYLVG